MILFDWSFAPIHATLWHTGYLSNAHWSHHTIRWFLAYRYLWNIDMHQRAYTYLKFISQYLEDLQCLKYILIVGLSATYTEEKRYLHTSLCAHVTALGNILCLHLWCDNAVTATMFGNILCFHLWCDNAVTATMSGIILCLHLWCYNAVTATMFGNILCLHLWWDDSVTYNLRPHTVFTPTVKWCSNCYHVPQHTNGRIHGYTNDALTQSLHAINHQGTDTERSHQNESELLLSSRGIPMHLLHLTWQRASLPKRML